METLIRLSKSEDLPFLHQIWEEVFASPDKDLFFNYFYKLERCVVAQINKEICAMGFILPAGYFVHRDASFPCSMIYALATLPKYRKNGLGAKIVSELVLQSRKSGYPVTILCPSSDDIFNYYKAKTEFKEGFYINSRNFKSPPASPSSNTQISELSAEVYVNLRNQKLTGKSHVLFELDAVVYQEKLCRFTGGGLYRVDGNGWFGILAVEKLSDDAIIIKELLCPREHEDKALFAISSIFPGCEVTVRTPVDFNSKSDENLVRRFGMISSCLFEIQDLNLKDAWYGFAFD